MTNRLFATALFFLSVAAYAGQPVNDPALERYFRRSMENCPGSDVAIETINTPGPAGFKTYRATHTSADQRCGRKAYLLVSTQSDTMLVGDVFSIPAGPEPLEKRLSAFTGKMLKKAATAIIEKSSGKDGLRRVTIRTASKEGPFDVHGFVDQSNKFFIVGRRGSKSVDPGDALVKDLGATTVGATRGNPMARIRIVELSDMQCPTCKRAHDFLDPIIKKNLNRISYTRLDLPLFDNHDWSLKAAMAARAIQTVAPARYWDFVDYIFANQEVIKASTIDTMVRNFAEDHDIPWAKLQPLYTSATLKKQLMEQVGRAFDNAIFGTPTYIINGQPVFFGSGGEFVRSYIESLLKSQK